MKFRDEIAAGVEWSKVVPFFVVAAGVIAYVNSFACPFIFDDTAAILVNPKVHSWWPPWRHALLRPVGDLTFAINFAIGKFNVADYHATNLLIHIVAGLLLFGIVRRTLILPGFAGRWGGHAPWIAGASAILWVVHPIQTESVTYMCQRYESLAGMFYLLTLYSVIRGAEGGRSGRWYATAIVSATLGMGTKEIVVTAPVIILVYDWIFLSGSLAGALRRRWPLYAGFLLMSWGFMALTLFAASRNVQDVGHPFGMGPPVFRYILTQANVVTDYLRLSVLPYPLCLDYSLRVASSVREVLPGLVVTGGLGLLSVWALIRRPALGFLGLWFFGILAPTSILPVPDVMFEHRMYLSVAAVCVLAAVGAYGVISSLPRRSRAFTPAGARLIMGSLGLGIAVIWMGMTMYRNSDYASEERMWRDILAKRPDNLRVYISLSGEFIGQRRYREAASCCSNLLVRIAEVAKPIPGGEGERWAADTYVRQYYSSIIYAKGQNNLGISLYNLGHTNEALQCYEEALRVWPGYAQGLNNKAFALYQKGLTNDAVRCWQQSAEASTNNPTANCFLGIVYAETWRGREAVERFEAALRGRPDFAFVKQQFAWLLSTYADTNVRDGARAVRLAEDACRESGYESPRAMDTLSAALAEAGRFGEAVENQKAAIELMKRTLGDAAVSAGGPMERERLYSERVSASGETRTDLLRRMEARLGLYMEGTAFHEAPPASKARGGE